jgi:hypothetical protein
MSLDVRPSGDPRDQTVAHAPSTGRSLCFFRRRPTPDDLNAIRDSRFTAQLANLTSLKTLLLTRGVHIREEDVPLLSFGMLNHLRYSEKGRLPTDKEWEELDKRSQKLFSYLDDELRKRFELSQTANLIAGLPVLFIFLALLLVALLSLLTTIFAVDRNLLLLGCYFLWTALLGAIGAIAFLSMNTLSIQKDITFDLTNKSLLAVRIVLGALFGFFLSMPFGFYSFVTFWESIAHGTPAPGAPNFSFEAALLLVPFVLGLGEERASLDVC